MSHAGRAILAATVADETIYTREALVPFDRIAQMVWVLDVERGSQWWCNLATLPLFGEPTREAMLARFARGAPSETARTRLEALLREVGRGERLIDRWTMYPEGREPFVAECRGSIIRIADSVGEPARDALFIEARVLGADEVDPAERRGIEALRYLGELVSLYDESGHALMRNPAAVRALGDPGPGDQLAASLVDPGEAARLREALGREPSVRADLQVRGAAGERWYDSELRRSLDPVTGRPAVLVTQRDISERRAQQAELEAQRAQLAAQADELLRLAAPVLRVAADALVLPLIGGLDRERAAVALDALLARVAAGGVRRVILDLTGVAEFDAVGARGLLRIVRVLRLQGVDTAFSGIHPALAQAVVRQGDELGDVVCHASLAEALAVRPRR